MVPEGFCAKTLLPPSSSSSSHNTNHRHSGKSNLHRTPAPPTRFFDPESKHQPVQIPHPHPLLIPPQPLHALRSLASTKSPRWESVHRAHAFVIDDEFLVNAPDFHLPGQTAEGRRGLGLDVLRERDVGGAGVGCLADGGAEEEVAKAGEVGFFSCFAGCCGAGSSLRGGGFGVAGENAGVAGPAVVVRCCGGSAEGAGVAGCAACCACAGRGTEDEDVGDCDGVGGGGVGGGGVVEDGCGGFWRERGGCVVVLAAT